MPAGQPTARCAVCSRTLGHPGSARGLCARCYRRALRGAAPAPVSLKAANGEGGEAVSFRLPRAVVGAVEARAEAEGMTVSDWCRRAVGAQLERESRTRK